MYSSVGVVDDLFHSSSKSLKQTSSRLDMLRRTRMKNKFATDDERISTILQGISSKISSICVDLEELDGVTHEPNDIVLPDNISMTSKEFILLHEVFALYTNQVMENSSIDATHEPDL